jgi:hypothetical protein
MFYVPTKGTVIGLDSKTYSLRMPLIKAPGRPANGWRVSLAVKGQTISVDGKTPMDVYNNSVQMLRRNGMDVPADDIWLNLNIQWLARTPERYHLVPAGDLMLISKVGLAGEVHASRRSYKPSDWGRLAWGWLNLFLAREEFHYREFLVQLKYVLDLLNPDTNPEIGCAECYREFSIMVSKIQNKPGMTREEARQWLVSTHNSVNARLGKKVLTFETASKLAFWT